MAQEGKTKAVSGLFRVWGNPPPLRPPNVMAGPAALCESEKSVFSVLVPGSLWLMAAEFFLRWFSLPIALVAAVIPAIVLSHLLPLCLLRKPLLQWSFFLLGMLAWSWFHAGNPLAWLWIAIGFLEIAAWLTLGIVRCWRVSRFFRLLLLLSCCLLSFALGFYHGWFVGFMTANGFAAWFCWGTLHPGSRLFGAIKTQTAPDHILITIDDGPDDDTPAILDLLDQFETKAVFFLIGEKAACKPALVSEIHQRGHPIGNHTMTHPQSSFWCAGPWRTMREIRACQQTLQRITGKFPQLFRAPVGHHNLFTHPVLHFLNLDLMGWSARGFDAVTHDPQTVLRRLLPGIQPGAIILLHQGQPASLEILRAVLEKRHEQRSSPGHAPA